MSLNISDYFNFNNGRITFTRKQASDFAKGVAGDFNPIHDEDAKRFCVPGDLLFAVFLSHYGIFQEMKFEFSGMVADGTALNLPENITSPFNLQDEQEKSYIDISFSGVQSDNYDFICSLAEKYVQFSGQTFPHILVPLMRDEGVMINPARPLVIYKNMEIHLDVLNGQLVELQLQKSLLDNQGKKAEVRLEFDIMTDGQKVGYGAKNLILSGLREFDQSQLDDVITAYNHNKESYLNT